MKWEIFRYFRNVFTLYVICLCIETNFGYSHFVPCIKLLLNSSSARIGLCMRHLSIWWFNNFEETIKYESVSASSHQIWITQVALFPNLWLLLAWVFKANLLLCTEVQRFMLCVETKHGLNINQCGNYLFSTIKGSFIFAAKFVRTSIAVGCGLMFILKLVESLWNLTTKPQEIIIKLLVINSSSFLNKTKIYKFNFQTIPSFLSNSFLYFL